MSIISSTSPSPATTTNAYVTVPGSTMSTIAGGYASVSFIVKNTHASASLKYRVIACNESISAGADIDIAVQGYAIVQDEATLANGVSGVFAGDSSPFRYYAVQVTDGSGHATVTVNGLVKD